MAIRPRTVSTDRIHLLGNPVIALLLLRGHFDADAARRHFGLLERYGVVTCAPRMSTLRDTAVAAVEAILAVSELLPIVIPLHPRGRATLEAPGWLTVPGSGNRRTRWLRRVHVAGRDAALVITDSGGIEEETTILGVPHLGRRNRPRTGRSVGTKDRGNPRSMFPEHRTRPNRRKRHRPRD